MFVLIFRIYTVVCFDMRKHDYSGYLNFVISIVGFVIFVDIEPFYTINSDAINLFTDSSF
jgi:hypothetical protein